MKVTTRVFCLLFSLLAAAEAHAQLRVDASDQRQSLDCKGQALLVLGSRNQLTLSGQCSKVEINGSDNVVTVDTIDEIEVVGQRNRVSWQRTIGDRRSPRVSTVGPGNEITQLTVAKPATKPVAPNAAADPPKAASAPMAPAARATLSRAWVVDGSTLRLPGNGQRESIDCDGHDLIILGNSNTVTARGHCASISVPGTSNTVAAESVSRIRSEGDNNQFTWRRLHDGREPQVTLLGSKNTVNKIR